jgi:hypothetical protein
MMAPGQPSAEFSPRIYGRIDLAAQPLLDRADRGHDLPETDITHHADVHVAALTLFPSGNGSVNERQLDPFGQRPQGLAQHLGDRRGLDHESLQFSEHRALPIGLEEHLVAARRSANDPGSSQMPQLPLGSAHARPRNPGNLAHVEGLVRPRKEQREHCSAGLAEQGG